MRRLVVLTDVKGFGGLPEQFAAGMQGRFHDVRAEAYLRAGIGWETLPAGDAATDLLDPRIDEPRQLAEFVGAMTDLLAVDNTGRTDAARMRVRMGIGQGPVGDGDNGYRGQVLSAVTRLRDAPAAYAALDRDPVADLVVVVAEDVHRYSIDGSTYRLGREQFVPVTVSGKPGDLVGGQPAWLCLPGRPVPAPVTDPPEPVRPASVPTGGLILPDGPLPPAHGPF